MPVAHWLFFLSSPTAGSVWGVDRPASAIRAGFGGRVTEVPAGSGALEDTIRLKKCLFVSFENSKSMPRKVRGEMIGSFHSERKSGRSLPLCLEVAMSECPACSVKHKFAACGACCL